MTAAKDLLQLAQKDRLYALAQARDFAFGAQVADVFDDMISRSVPCYLESQLLISSVASRYYRPGTSVYDLGCSTGTSLVLVAKRLRELSPRIVGVDSSEPMLSKADEKLSRLGIRELVELEHRALEEVALKRSSLVLLNYTLQFVDVEIRLEILKGICRSLVPGGVLLFSEKTRSNLSEDAEMIQNLHEDFKRQNGYSDSEIAKKREALKGVLVPLSPEENEELLRSAGFGRVVRIMQGYEFITWLAVL